MSCVRFIRENETTVGNQEPERAQPMDDAMRHAVYQQLCFPYLYERFVKRMAEPHYRPRCQRTPHSLAIQLNFVSMPIRFSCFFTDERATLLKKWEVAIVFLLNDTKNDFANWIVLHKETIYFVLC